MDATIITAIGGLITGVLGIVIATMTSRSAATKSEVESLRETIKLLQDENKRLRERMKELEAENTTLHRQYTEAQAELELLRCKLDAINKGK